MLNKIKLKTKEAKDLLRMFNAIVDADGKEYYYLPVWFEETDEEGVYNILPLGKLPKDLKVRIRRARSGFRNTKWSSPTDFPVTKEDAYKI